MKNGQDPIRKQAAEILKRYSHLLPKEIVDASDPLENNISEPRVNGNGIQIQKSGVYGQEVRPLISKSQRNRAKKIRLLKLRLEMQRLKNRLNKGK